MAIIRDLLPVASQRLVTIESTGAVIQAAGLLSGTGTALVVVCDTAGRMCGVITKADIVREISHCTGCSCTENVSDIMTREVISCGPDEKLVDVWAIMRAKALKQIPIRDTDSQPLGLLYANDALEALLKEVEYEELMLRDYVMGVGYR